MSKVGYQVDTGAAVALVAATAKTALFIYGPSTHGLQVTKFSIGFDGVTASAVPVFWELNYLTAASNSTPGTNNTTATINQVYGRAITSSNLSAGYACTAEPTVQTNLRSNLLTPNGGLLVYDFPLGTEPDSAVSQGFCLRLTAPAAVNVRCEMFVERV